MTKRKVLKNAAIQFWNATCTHTCYVASPHAHTHTSTRTPAHAHQHTHTSTPPYTVQKRFNNNMVCWCGD